MHNGTKNRARRMSRSRHTQITVMVAVLLLAPTALSAVSEEAQPLDAFVANDMVLILRATNPTQLEMTLASDEAKALPRPKEEK